MPTRLCPGPTPGQPCPTRTLVTTRPGSKTAGRCSSCRGAWQRGKDARRPDRRTYAEQQRRRQTVADWVSAHGYLCPGCEPSNWQPHAADPTSNPLTAEHVEPFAATGNERGPLTVMCRQGNSSAGARLRRQG